MRGSFFICRLAAIAALVFSSALSQDDLAKLYAEAQQAQAAGDLATASLKYEAIVRLRPQMAEAYANLGNLYYQQGQMDRAKSAYQKAIGIKPELAGPYLFLGVIEFGAHDYSSALRDLQRAETLQGSNVLIHAYLGYTQYARSSFREAAEELEKAAALDPTDIDVLYNLCKSYSHLAKDSFAELQKRFPNSPYTNLARAHLYETKEDWKVAAEQYRLAVEKLPDNARLRKKSAWMEAKATGASSVDDTGASDELIDASLAYKDLVLSVPKIREETARWQSKIRASMESHRSDQVVYIIAEGYQALSYLCSLAVFQSDSDSYRSHQLHAQLLEESNDEEGAIAEYRAVLKRKPELQNIHFAIGTLYWKDQHFDQARPELQQELQANPNHPQALYELGDMAALGGDAQSAERYFLKSLKIDPNMVEAHLALEKIYTQSGRYEMSLEHLRRALQLDSSDPTVDYRLSLVYRMLGRKQDADRELAIFNQKRAQSGSSTVK